jgi:regulator of sirC expression with transglutaminase-like and TPR domain
VSPGPLERFARLVQSPEGDLPLDEAALLVATSVRPVDVDEGLARLDELAAGCGRGDPDDVSAYLFGELGFEGDTADYQDPRNSFLDDVMTRRRGIPITLSVLMMEVGRRCGAAVLGVGMPGHFLVRDATDADAFFDPFHGGGRLDADGARARFHALRGAAPFHAEFLAPVGPRAILSRMLANLQNTFLARQPAAVAPVIRMRLTIPDLSTAERYELASVLGTLGHYDQAAALLERLAPELAEADASRVRQQIVALRARGN